MKEYIEFSIDSKELKREVKISVFLPKNYVESTSKYPVLYMHDGQNLFDNDLASFGKSWGIIESYKKDTSLPEIIIVGIDSTDTRTEELVPFPFKYMSDNALHGGNSGEYYAFIINNLKPLIDEQYRTHKCANKTGIMGSSYGGLSSIYAALEYSKYFSRFGCVSSAFKPCIKEIENLVKTSTLSEVKKLYMDVGSKETLSEVENEDYLSMNRSVFELLSKKIEPNNLKFEIIKDAIHHESAWEKRFPEIIKFLYSE